jgi:hypothetical protein
MRYVNIEKPNMVRDPKGNEKGPPGDLRLKLQALMPRGTGLGNSSRAPTACTSRIIPDRQPLNPCKVHCSLGGCSSRLNQACTSDNRMGSMPSHWRHWNLRPPVFKTMKCISLRHFKRWEA